MWLKLRHEKGSNLRECPKYLNTFPQAWKNVRKWVWTFFLGFFTLGVKVLGVFKIFGTRF